MSWFKDLFINEAKSSLSKPSGSGGVSSWNDLTDRPFYEMFNEGVVIENQTVVVANGYAELDNVNGMIKTDTIYTVTFDGVSYECVAWYSHGWYEYIIGNSSYIDSSGSGEDVPFAINFYDGGAYLNSDDGEHTIEIHGLCGVAKKLEKKYLPDDLATLDQVREHILYRLFTDDTYLYHDGRYISKVTRDELDDILDNYMFLGVNTERGFAIVMSVDYYDDYIEVYYGNTASTAEKLPK